MTPEVHPLARLPLRAVAGLYGVALRFRNRYYDRPRSSCRPEVPVVSIGNLTVGGTGKTPLVHWLATRLLDRGRYPAVVSRGYGGRAGRGPLTVSTGAGPLHDAATCGDEPHMLASTTTGIPIVVGSDRCLGAQAACSLGVDVILLDDGFQHRRIARDLDIVLLDATNPFGNGRLLPAGPLREPLTALRRAGLVLLTRSRHQHDTDAIQREIRRHNPDVTILRAGHRRVGFRGASRAAAAAPRRALVFCGIGNPDAFREDVAAEGVEIVAFEPRRDHQPYHRLELERLQQRATALDAVLVTTAKDRARLPSTVPGLLTLEIEAAPFDPAPLWEVVERSIGGRRDG